MEKQMETVRHILPSVLIFQHIKQCWLILKTQVREKEVDVTYYELCDRIIRNICHNNIWRVYDLLQRVVWHKIDSMG
jgi:hypothetical protein